jgi:hypothetical protein
MLLPEGHYLYPGHPNLHGYVRFLNLDTGTLVRIQILLLGDHCAIDSVDGLLLLLRDSDQEGTVRLLHPFTGDITELPPLGTLLPQPQVDSCIPDGPTPYRIRQLARFVCASVSFKAGAMTIMLALHDVWRVAYATSQDRQWTLSSWLFPMLYAPLSFQGKLYIVGTPRIWESMHQVFQIDPPGQDGAGADPQLQPPKLIATIPTGKLIHPHGLVLCGTEILVLGQNDLLVSQILVCKLADLVLQRFIPVDNIGDNTLFLGERNLSVSSKILPTVKSDSVVYKCSREPYLAQYHLSSGSLTPAIDDCSLYGLAPGPSSLVHYIFSCCTRDLWYVSVFSLFSFCTVSPYHYLFCFGLPRRLFHYVLVGTEDSYSEEQGMLMDGLCKMKSKLNNEASPSSLVFYTNTWFTNLGLEFAYTLFIIIFKS